MVNQMNIRSVYHVPNIFLEIRLLLMLGHLVSHDHIGMAYEEPPCPWCRARGAVPVVPCPAAKTGRGQSGDGRLLRLMMVRW